MEKATFTIAINKRTCKYGVKNVLHAGWWIEPVYDAVQGEEGPTDRETLWVKKAGKFDYLNIVERKEQVP